MAPGSFFLCEAETTRELCVEPWGRVVQGRRAATNDEGMPLIMGRDGEEPLMRLLCESWHEGC